MPPRKKATSKRVTKEDANPARKPRAAAAKKTVEAAAPIEPGPTAPKAKKPAKAPALSKSAEILQMKREAQRARADEGTTAQGVGRGPAAIQGRGPSGRTRGPVKK